MEIKNDNKELNEIWKLIDMLLSSLPQCYNGAHENRPATKKFGSDGSKTFCDECGTGTFYVRDPDDFLYAEALRQILKVKRNREVKLITNE